MPEFFLSRAIADAHSLRESESLQAVRQTHTLPLASEAETVRENRSISSSRLVSLSGFVIPSKERKRREEQVKANK